MVTVDFHLHVGKYEMYPRWVHEFQRKMNPTIYSDYEKYVSPEGILRLLDEAGMEYGVALAEYNPMVTGIVPNEYIAEFCGKSERLIAFASVNPWLMADPARKFEEALSKLKMRGLKIYPSYQHVYPNDGRLYPVYRKAEEFGVPVMFHTGSSIFQGSKIKYSNPIYLDDIAVDFPDLKIVMAHGGRGLWYKEAFFLARTHRNVYLEVSGLPPKNLLKYFPELERIPDKIIFGSDFPGATIKECVKGIESLPLTESLKRKILGENAAKILEL
ncbi:MAG: amidohydrolase [Candidatus Hecatellales archaeon]|nr:MAG: amidohydrolase [Candidatus Hecatellales archaeon]